MDLVPGAVVLPDRLGNIHPVDNTSIFRHRFQADRAAWLDRFAAALHAHVNQRQRGVQRLGEQGGRRDAVETGAHVQCGEFGIDGYAVLVQALGRRCTGGKRDQNTRQPGNPMHYRES